MKKLFSIWAFGLSLAVWIQSVSAHYLFLSIDPEDGEHGAMNLYFEEAPAPGDGFYLDPFIQRGQAWLRLSGVEKSEPLKLTEVKVEEKNHRWLTSKLSKSGPRSVESYTKWGVYKYGKTDVLLHYYAKFIDVETPEQLAEVGQSDNLKLDVRPTWEDDKLRLEVMWDGKPAPDTKIYLRGPGLKGTINTDANGKATLKPEKPGQYSLRAYHREGDKSGTFEDKSYEEVRHHSSLTIILPLGN